MSRGPAWPCLRARWVFCLAYGALWLGFFLLGKIGFLIYHLAQTRILDPSTVVGVLAYGLRLDIAAASYVCGLPFLIVALTAPLSSRLTASLVGTYTALAIVLVSLLTVADLELFAAWGHHIDDTVLLYVTTPREMFASAASSSLPVLCALFVALAAVGLGVCALWVLPRIRAFPRAGLSTVALVLPTLLGLVVGGRGGFQGIPINQSSVYFTTNEFANQAAVNATWIFFDAVSDLIRASDAPLALMPQDEATRLVEDLRPPPPAGPTVRLLTTPRPTSS